MNTITKQAWRVVHNKACDIANAVIAEDDVLAEIYRSQMFDVLDELEAKFGVHPQIIATRADYMNDLVKRRAVYNEALKIARHRGDDSEVNEILDSLKCIEDED